MQIESHLLLIEYPQLHSRQTDWMEHHTLAIPWNSQLHQLFPRRQVDKLCSDGLQDTHPIKRQIQTQLHHTNRRRIRRRSHTAGEVSSPRECPDWTTRSQHSMEGTWRRWYTWYNHSGIDRTVPRLLRRRAGTSSKSRRGFADCWRSGEASCKREWPWSSSPEWSGSGWETSWASIY